MADSYDFSAFDAGDKKDDTKGQYDFGAFDEQPSAAAASSPSMLESALLGAGESASFGALPKLSGAKESPLGAGKSLLELLTPGLYEYSKQGDKDVAKYEAGKKAMEARLSQASAENPVSYGAGTLGGGALLGAATMGLGEAPAAIGMGAKVAQGAKLGAGYGGLQGLLGSEADTLGGKIESGLSGLATGAVTGAALPAVGAGLGKLGGALAEKTKLGRAAQMGLEGRNIVTEAGRREIQDSLRSGAASDIYEQLSSYGKDLGKNFKSILEQYGNKNISFDEAQGHINKLINSLDDRIPSESTDKNKLIGLVKNFLPEKSIGTLEQVQPGALGGPELKAELPTEDLLKLKRGFQDYSKFQRGLGSSQGESVAGQGARKLGEALKEVTPGLEQADEKYHVFKEQVMKELGVKNVDEPGAVKKLQRALFNAEADTGIGSNTRIAVDNAMKSLKDINPELAESISKNIKKTSKDVQIAREATNAPMPTGGNILKTIGGQSLKISNAVGLGAKFLSNVTSDNLAIIGNSLKSSQVKSANKLGAILTEAASRDQIARNAIIFSLMQNSDYRDLINNLISGGQ